MVKHFIYEERKNIFGAKLGSTPAMIQMAAIYFFIGQGLFWTATSTNLRHKIRVLFVIGGCKVWANQFSQKKSYIHLAPSSMPIN